ncbi:hypothetical protein CC80DRAFT_557768 [Byssothecium circinans]|uniref:Mg2+ transporter protein n=1 Tax=Byssothecium circinans TaxID=147558 RepID=A0A6A5UII8_9PLEO|nr:hypothetical protein CC80DRAFT_557768 [Byssothecium circinans]
MASPPRPILDKTSHSSRDRTNTKRERPCASPYITKIQTNANTQADLTVVSEREYADRVKSYARLWTGQHYHDLANYLFAPYQRFFSDATSKEPKVGASPIGERFVTMYTVDGHRPPQARQISSPLEFSQAAIDAEDLSALIFLRGHQPPEMLNAIGGRYRVDPEFFRQHLEVNSRTGWLGNFLPTSLPSTWKNIVRLPSVSLASRSSSGYSRSSQPHHEEKLSKIRNETARLLDGHIEKYLQSRESHLSPGSSIVRNLSIHNNQYFSLEQHISIYMAAHGKSWIGIVWLDTGSDLGQDKSGPWQAQALQCESWEVQFLPTIQHQPGAALNSRHLFRANTLNEVTDEKGPGRLIQTSARLHENYGEHLDYETMAASPFYALTDVFAFVAASEGQFLDLIQLFLDTEIDIDLLSRYSLQTRAALWNLAYNKQILDRHHRRLRDISSFLKNYSQIVNWACPTAPATQKISSDAAARLHMDYTHLVERCHTLNDAFDGAMDVLQNNSIISESQKAIQQAEGVAQLTRLAFFFIPLSLTASIFGMNMRQFTDGAPLSIWVWVVTSAVTLLFSYLVLK